MKHHHNTNHHLTKEESKEEEEEEEGAIETLVAQNLSDHAPCLQVIHNGPLIL